MNLVYSVLAGAALDAPARCFVQSLRAHGHAGAVVLFCDHPFAGDCHVERVVAPGTPTEVQMMRVRCGLTLDLERYRTVAYLDVDQLAVAELTPLFSRPGFVGHSEGRPLGRSLCHGGFLTPPEKVAATGECYNSGLLIGPGGGFREALSAWRDEYGGAYAGAEKFREQAALNAAAFHGRIPISPLPPGVVAGCRTDSPPYVTADTVLVHHWGRGKGLMVRTWDRRNRVLSPARPRMVSRYRPAGNGA